MFAAWLAGFLPSCMLVACNIKKTAQLTTRQTLKRWSTQVRQHAKQDQQWHASCMLHCAIHHVECDPFALGPQRAAHLYVSALWQLRTV
jgi:hypothetical protein